MDTSHDDNRSNSAKTNSPFHFRVRFLVVGMVFAVEAKPFVSCFFFLVDIHNINCFKSISYFDGITTFAVQRYDKNPNSQAFFSKCC